MSLVGNNFSLATLRDTLWQQIVTGSGLAESRVIWYTQSGIRPELENAKLWIGINLIQSKPLNEFEFQNNYSNPDPSPGNDIIIETTGHYEFTFSIHVFSMNTVGGDGYAPDVLLKVRKYLGRQGVLSIFSNIHAPIVERGPILHIPTVLNTKYESRANMALRVRAAVTDQETTTYIQEVIGTITTGDVVNEFDIALSGEF